MKMMKVGMRLSSYWRLPNAAERAPTRPFDFDVHPPNFFAAPAIAGALRHDPEKWQPVFRKDHAQTTS
jgi:hypothetical protein